MFRKTIIFLFCLFLIFCKQPLSANNIEEFKENIEQVSQRLLCKIENPPEDLTWPPRFDVIDDSQINAYAQIIDRQPIVTIHYGLSEIAEAVPDRIAYIIAHELIHITKGHCSKLVSSSDNVLGTMYSREHEKEADIEGLKLAMKAGFSYQKSINTFKILRTKLGDYSPIEAQLTDHPSWSERLSYVDLEQKNLWQSMSTFQNGVSFILTQNFEAANACFEKVIKEFLSCYEAYANLGYAHLMQYVDLFDLDDIKYFGTGHIVVSGFYRRPESLESAVRGIDEELWWKSVGYMKRALDLSPAPLALVQSHLGIAYFLDPRQQSFGQSEKYLTLALENIEKDTSLDLNIKACVYLNAGAIDIATKKYENALAKLENANNYQKKFEKTASRKLLGNTYTGTIGYNRQIENALLLNKILTEYNLHDQILEKNSLQQLLRYLRKTEPSSVWWQLAYDMYQTAVKNNGNTPLTREQILTNIYSSGNPVQSIQVEGFPIYLSQKIKDIKTKFNDIRTIPVVEDRKIFEYQFIDNSLSVIGGEEVIGIVIKKENKHIRWGSNNALVNSIQIGSPFNDFQEKYDGISLSYMRIPGENPKEYYFVNDLGIGLNVIHSLISEILIVQKPIR